MEQESATCPARELATLGHWAAITAGGLRSNGGIAVKMRGNKVTSDTCLQITETGKTRLKHIEGHYVLRSLMERSPIGHAVLSVLRRMDNGDVQSVKQLIDFMNQDQKLDLTSMVGPSAILAGSKASNMVTVVAIRRCVRRGYLAVTLTVEG